jgi:aspartokinase
MLVASYNKSVSRVRILTPVDHVTTACPKACANTKYQLAFCRSANTRVLAERQNASYNNSVSRVRILTPVDHITTACPKACANAKYLMAR